MIFIVKLLFIVIGLVLMLKAILKEDFDDLFLAIFILVIGIGLETI